MRDKKSPGAGNGGTRRKRNKIGDLDHDYTISASQTQASDRQFEIRDMREKAHFRIDTLFVKGGWSKALGVYGVGVYAVLACHANNDTQKAWPRQRVIADHLNCGKRQVGDALLCLELLNVIKREPYYDEKGHRGPDRVYLLDKSVWLHPDSLPALLEQHEREKREEKQRRATEKQAKNLSSPEEIRLNSPEETHELTLSLTNPILKEGRDSAPPSSVASKASQSEKKITKDAPAIQAYMRAMLRYPPKNTWPDIIAIVGDDPKKIEFWEKVVRAWKLGPWNDMNIQGMLDHFERGEIPTTKPAARAGEKNNGPGLSPFRRAQRERNL
jgi:hypothetical protein